MTVTTCRPATRHPPPCSSSSSSPWRPSPGASPWCPRRVPGKKYFLGAWNIFLRTYKIFAADVSSPSSRPGRGAPSTCRTAWTGCPATTVTPCARDCRYDTNMTQMEWTLNIDIYKLWLSLCRNVIVKILGSSIQFIFTLQVNSLNRGSCEGCEAACGVVFRPVCSRDQDTVYPNQCQAACAGAADTVECQVHCRN